MAFIKTKFENVSYRESTKKRHLGKPLKTFYYRFRKLGEKNQSWIKCGTSADGMTAGLAAGKLLEALSMQQEEKRQVATISFLDESSPEVAARANFTYGEAWEFFKKKWFRKLKHTSDIEGRYRNHVEKRWAATQVRAMTGLAIEDWAAEALYEEKELSAQTVNLILGDMRNVINRCKKYKLYAGHNPLEDVEFPDVDNWRTRFLSPNEVTEKLWPVLEQKSKKWYLIATISLNTGCRLSEVTGLQESKIDHFNKTASVTGKTGRRVVPLNKFAYEAVVEGMKLKNEMLVFPKKYRNERDIEVLVNDMGFVFNQIRRLQKKDVDVANWLILDKRSDRWLTMTERVRKIVVAAMEKTANDLVFPGVYGQRIGRDATKNSFARSVEEAGLNPIGTARLDRVVFHTLRHTFCSWQAKSGTPLWVIAKLVGHSSTTMTERYAHLCPATQLTTHIIVEEMLDGTAQYAETPITDKKEQLKAILSELIRDNGTEGVPQEVLQYLIAV